jgi:hypothetical protein
MSPLLLFGMDQRQLPAVVKELAPSQTVPGGKTLVKKRFSDGDSTRTSESPLAEQADWALVRVVRPVVENTPQNQ